MITKKFLINCIDYQFNDENIIFTKEELLAINKENLKDYTSKEPIMNRQHMDLLYACISSIDPQSREVTLDADSCNRIRQLITEHPEYYLSNFVGLGSAPINPEYNTIACEPYWKMLFRSATDFESFISKTKYDSIEHIQRTRNFWELYKNNSFKPIQFENQGNVQDMIDSVEAAHPACDIYRNALVLKVFTQFPHSIFLGDDAQEAHVAKHIT